MRTAISPRFAMRILLNIRGEDSLNEKGKSEHITFASFKILMLFGF